MSTPAMNRPPNARQRRRDIIGVLDNAYRRSQIRIVIIERGVPVAKIEQTKPEKYPFKQMEVGDRMLVDWEPNLRRVKCAAAQAGVRLKRKFKTRRKGNALYVCRTE